MPDERDQQPDEQTEESQAEASDLAAQSRLEEQLPAEGAVADVEIVEPEHAEPVDPELPSAEPVELELPPDEPVEPTEGLEPEAAPSDPQLPEDSRAPSPEPPESPDRVRLVYLEYEVSRLRRMVEDLSDQNDELPTMDDSPELDDATAMRVLGGAGVNSMQVGNSVALTASGQSGSSEELIREGGGDYVIFAMFAVKVWRDGGSTDGNKTTQCDRTYTVRTLDALGVGIGGELLGTGMNPTTAGKQRPTTGLLVTPPEEGGGVIGIGYYDKDDNFQLYDANEALDTDPC